MSNIRENPCRLCTKRNADCHSICKEYAAWKKQWQQFKLEQRRAQKVENDIRGYKDYKVERLRRNTGPRHSHGGCN